MMEVAKDVSFVLLAIGTLMMGYRLDQHIHLLEERIKALEEHLVFP